MSYGEQMQHVGEFFGDVGIGSAKGLANAIPETAALAYRMTGYAAAGVVSLFDTDISDRMFAQYEKVTGRVAEYDNGLQEASGTIAGLIGPTAVVRGAVAAGGLLRADKIVDMGLSADSFGNLVGTEALRGGRGPATAWRGFDETLAGGAVRDLTTDSVKVSQRGIDVVERHVSRFGADEANNVMINRLRQIEAGDLVATTQDLNFYTHELREFVRYRRLGWEKGLPSNADEARQLWLQAHSAILADYNLPLRSENLLYHPDAQNLIGW